MRNELYPRQQKNWRIINSGGKIWIEDIYEGTSSASWETCNEKGVCNLISGIFVKYYEEIEDAIEARDEFVENGKRYVY